jgi:GxxExxY protein
MYVHSDLTSKIIKAYFKVYNKLGYGFLEKVYENALLHELRSMNLTCFSQVQIDVYYEKSRVGVYFADLLVESKVIVELKAAECLREEHEAQLINYLRATKLEVGLLLNFGTDPQFKRKVFLNSYKSDTFV